ncbi:MAG: 2-succinyl-6-hydroxy-2,4-cyclohexadiene-carboxylic acid synthase/2-oxoglutarate decarboxylase, partial [Frankiales bacterium]|nr:2-succinyl-6-hydroxy-2,4-cyclohexadiene-carboxylic acid synthase/2-oxoglutarate decarboxylase [Frankiales bacterium]
MNPSTALARVLVDELVRGGVRDAVLSPGSRSAPLAFALHDADAAGRLRLHVRIDERSAGFLAVGLAKASGRPVPVVTTSGTAVANLHPAVLEAAHSGASLVVLSADRPPELRGAGANQTVDQLGLYGGAVRLFTELGVPEVRAGQNAYWRSQTCRVLAAAASGPVQVNVALRDPLVPTEGDWPEDLDGRPGGAPWTAVLPAAEPAGLPDDLPARTVVVLGDGPPGPAAAAQALAA